MGRTFQGKCPDPHASNKEQNENQDFLNCGVESGGWDPPNVKISDFKMLFDDEVEKSQLYSPCKQYLPAFKKASESQGVPVTLLVAFAMQESGCNPDTGKGINEERGMMELTPDKCGKAPGGDCFNVEFNINSAAAYFKQTLKESNDNFLETLGQYNGWFKGMTHADAVRAKAEGRCHEQNSLDYLYQMTAGWFLGVNAYDAHLGSYQNMDC